VSEEILAWSVQEFEAGRATFVGAETAVLTPAEVWKVKITSH